VRVADAGLRGGYVFADGAHEVHLGALVNILVELLQMKKYTNY